MFFREWFPLPKGEFRIMAMLAEKGQFRGNLSDLCRYFSVSPQTKSRRALKNQISELEKKGFITVQKTRNTYTLKAIPKVKRIEIERGYYEQIRKRHREPEEESVAWECVLKVYLWISVNDYDSLINNQMLKEDLDLTDGVICSAKKVLDKEFGAIHRHKVSKKVSNGEIHTLGQHLGASAFWNNQ